jgi:hypothetical protein
MRAQAHRPPNPSDPASRLVIAPGFPARRVTLFEGRAEKAKRQPELAEREAANIAAEALRISGRRESLELQAPRCLAWQNVTTVRTASLSSVPASISPLTR